MNPNKMQWNLLILLLAIPSMSHAIEVTAETPTAISSEKSKEIQIEQSNLLKLNEKKQGLNDQLEKKRTQINDGQKNIEFIESAIKGHEEKKQELLNRNKNTGRDEKNSDNKASATPAEDEEIKKISDLSQQASDKLNKEIKEVNEHISQSKELENQIIRINNEISKVKENLEKLNTSLVQAVEKVSGKTPGRVDAQSAQSTENTVPAKPFMIDLEDFMAADMAPIIKTIYANSKELQNLESQLHQETKKLSSLTYYGTDGRILSGDKTSRKTASTSQKALEKYIKEARDRISLSRNNLSILREKFEKLKEKANLNIEEQKKYIAILYNKSEWLDYMRSDFRASAYAKAYRRDIHDINDYVSNLEQMIVSATKQLESQEYNCKKAIAATENATLAAEEQMDKSLKMTQKWEAGKPNSAA